MTCSRGLLPQKHSQMMIPVAAVADTQSHGPGKSHYLTSHTDLLGLEKTLFIDLVSVYVPKHY